MKFSLQMRMGWLSALAATTIGSIFFLFGNFGESDTRELFSASAGASGTLLGFLLAALALLTAALERQLVVNMRKTGSFDALLKDVVHTCLVLVAALSIALVSQISPLDCRKFLATILIWLQMYALGFVLIVGRQFSIVLRFL